MLDAFFDTLFAVLPGPTFSFEERCSKLPIIPRALVYILTFGIMILAFVSAGKVFSHQFDDSPIVSVVIFIPAMLLLYGVVGRAILILIDSLWPGDR